MAGLLHQLNRFVNAVLVALQLTVIAAQTGVVDWDPIPLAIPLGIFVAIKAVIRIASWRDVKAVTDETLAKSRVDLINMMARGWIGGVLDAALAQEVFSLAIDTRYSKPGMRPYNMPSNLLAVMQSHTRLPVANALPPADAIVRGVFRDVKRKLTLVGEAGAGKTILLLQLANALLEEARADEENAVPLIFDLSSWTKASTTLELWLIDELGKHYGFSKELARAWLDNDGLIYLLDGLDEVPEESRGACVAAINRFLTRRRQVIVSCRLDEFAVIAEQLEIKTVVEILPLAKAHVREALERELEIAKVDAILREAGGSEKTWRAISKPLVVGSIAKAYVGESFEVRAADDDEDSRSVIRRMVIEPLLENQLRAVGRDERTAERYRTCLCWLAHCMKLRNQSKFYLETMQGDWLPKKPGALQPITRLLRPFTLSFAGKLEFSTERFVSIAFLTISLSLTMGLLYKLAHNDAENERNTLRQQRREIPQLFAPVHEPVTDSGFDEFFEYMSRDIKANSRPLYPVRRQALGPYLDYARKRYGWSNALYAAADMAYENLMDRLLLESFMTTLFGTLCVSWVSGFIGSIDRRMQRTFGEALRTKRRFVLYMATNFGFLLSATILSISLLSADFPYAYLREVGRIAGRSTALYNASLTMSYVLQHVLFYWFVGLVLSLCTWCYLGQSLIKHTILRAALVARGLSPLRFDCFIESMLDAGLLRQVGGGVFFVHRELMEFLAEEWQSKRQPKHGSANRRPPQREIVGNLLASDKTSEGS